MNKDAKNNLRLLVVKWATAYEDAHPEIDEIANTEALKTIHAIIIDRQPKTVPREWVERTVYELYWAGKTGGKEYVAEKFINVLKEKGIEVTGEG